jgi:hypothetical protein
MSEKCEKVSEKTPEAKLAAKFYRIELAARPPPRVCFQEVKWILNLRLKGAEEILDL